MIYILLGLVQSAFAIESVQVTIDGSAYSCHLEGAEPTTESTVDLNASIDTECLKQNRLKNPSANLYQVEKWALHTCRTKVLNLDTCRLLATKPNSTCSTLVEGWFFSLNNHQRLMIANFCKTQVYKCE